MRKFVLIAAMVLACASAQAGGSRSLTLAANDEYSFGQVPQLLLPGDSDTIITAG